jgi:uncharacterized membrane protein YobD (UPF0266 family)
MPSASVITVPALIVIFAYGLLAFGIALLPPKEENRIWFYWLSFENRLNAMVITLIFGGLLALTVQCVMVGNCHAWSWLLCAYLALSPFYVVWFIYSLLTFQEWVLNYMKPWYTV